MSTKTAKPTEILAGEPEKLPVTTVEHTEVTEKQSETVRGNYVYCGPTVKGVARQFTVYRGGIPRALEDFLEDHKIAKRLLIPENQFAQMRVKLGTPGTGEYILLQKLNEELR